MLLTGPKSLLEELAQDQDQEQEQEQEPALEVVAAAPRSLHVERSATSTAPALYSA